MTNPDAVRKAAEQFSYDAETGFSDYSLYMGYLAAHASRDAEVDALREENARLRPLWWKPLLWMKWRNK